MNRYNQVPHLTQDTNGKVTNSQLDITNESQEVYNPFIKAGGGFLVVFQNCRATMINCHKACQSNCLSPDNGSKLIFA